MIVNFRFSRVRHVFCAVFYSVLQRGNAMISSFSSVVAVRQGCSCFFCGCARTAQSVNIFQYKTTASQGGYLDHMCKIFLNPNCLFR